MLSGAKHLSKCFAGHLHCNARSAVQVFFASLRMTLEGLSP